MKQGMSKPIRRFRILFWLGRGINKRGMMRKSPTVCLDKRAREAISPIK